LGGLPQGLIDFQHGISGHHQFGVNTGSQTFRYQ
jgi:hypothetical protein